MLFKHRRVLLLHHRVELNGEHKQISWWLLVVVSSYACYEERGKSTYKYHGGYGVAVAQRLVEPLVRVQLPIVTPDAETQKATQ